MSHTPRPKSQLLLDPIQITKIHWKAQALANICFGLPMSLLVVTSWGFSTMTLIRLLIFYLLIYFFIFFPFFAVLPRITLRSFKPTNERFGAGHKLSHEQQKKALEFLVNYPLLTFFKILPIVFSAFILAGGIIYAGFFPDFVEVKTTAVAYAIFLGLVVSLTESLLNQLFLENFFASIVEKFVEHYPHLMTQKLNIHRQSIFSKIFIVIFSASVAGQVSITLFFLTNLYLSAPEILPRMGLFALFLIAFSAIYIFVIAPQISRNITEPLLRLIRWNQRIMKGDTGSRMHLVTNDELTDVLRFSNQMMNQLNEAREQTVQSLKELEFDKQLISSERHKLSVILAGIVDGVVALDKNKRIILVNPAAEKVTNWKEAEVMMKHVDEVVLLYDKDDERILADTYCEPAKPSLAPHFEQKFLKLLTKHKEERFVHISASKVEDNAPEGTNYIVTFQDITQQREFEQMKFDFVSMAAHELRAPLTAIVGYVSVFTHDFHDSLNDEQQMFMNRINASTKRLSALVENLLNVSRLERDALTLNLEALSWPDIVKQTTNELQFLANEKKITLNFLLPEKSIPPINGDKLRLTEVLTNLISNAIKYTPSNGRIDVMIETQDDSIITHIKDNGIGIPSHAIPQLFSKFYRVPSSEVQNEKGTGLGLFISKAIVEMHKGSIWVESQEGQGSTFSFSLPVITGSNN